MLREDSVVVEEKEEDVAVLVALLLQPVRSIIMQRSIDSIALIFFISFPFSTDEEALKNRAFKLINHIIFIMWLCSLKPHYY